MNPVRIRPICLDMPLFGTLPFAWLAIAMFVGGLFVPFLVADGSEREGSISLTWRYRASRISLLGTLVVVLVLYGICLSNLLEYGLMIGGAALVVLTAFVNPPSADVENAVRQGFDGSPASERRKKAFGDWHQRLAGVVFTFLMVVTALVVAFDYIEDGNGDNGRMAQGVTLLSLTGACYLALGTSIIRKGEWSRITNKYEYGFVLFALLTLGLDPNP